MSKDQSIAIKSTEQHDKRYLSLREGSWNSKYTDESTTSCTEDDDSIENNSICSSFDIDEYSSSTGTTESDDDDDDDDDIQFDDEDDDDDDNDDNDREDWQNGSKCPLHLTEDMSPTPYCDGTPTPRCPALRSSWAPSRKQVRFNTITIRKFKSDYSGCCKGNVPHACASAKDSNMCETDLTLDLRDYEWVQRNLRRIVNKHYRTKSKPTVLAARAS